MTSWTLEPPYWILITMDINIGHAHGHATVMGTAPVDADGSFLVRTPADRPIRFALLDQKG